MINPRNRTRPTEKPVEAMKGDTSLMGKGIKKVPACGIVGGLTAMQHSGTHAHYPKMVDWLS